MSARDLWAIIGYSGLFGAVILGFAYEDAVKHRFPPQVAISSDGASQSSRVLSADLRTNADPGFLVRHK